jgi:hypothetical protein
MFLSSKWVVWGSSEHQQDCSLLTTKLNQFSMMVIMVSCSSQVSESFGSNNFVSCLLEEVKLELFDCLIHMNT